jgi:hypothetical protein
MRETDFGTTVGTRLSKDPKCHFGDPPPCARGGRSVCAALCGERAAAVSVASATLGARTRQTGGRRTKAGVLGQSLARIGNILTEAVV